MATRVHCIITNVTDGAAFAVREDTDENIYIPAKLSEHLDLDDMDRLLAVVVKNKVEKENTPWVMIRARHVDGEGNFLDTEELG